MGFDMLAKTRLDVWDAIEIFAKVEVVGQRVFTTAVTA